MAERLKQLPREERVNQILEKTGAILHGHFLATSGLHLDTYLEKRDVYPHIDETTEICEMFAEEFKEDEIGVVVAPATGGIILGFETAKQLKKRKGKDVLNCFLEKTTDGFEFKGDFAGMVKGKRVLIVDDILTTGGSITKAVDAVAKAGGETVAVGIVCDRRKEDEELKVPGVKRVIALGRKKGLNAYKPEECPHCKRGEPLERRGSK